ncbi:MAG: hypothetical protein POG24_06300, partial [Acidocella sp.]|nr:hypothetical protein [Acidocella sp.]
HRMAMAERADHLLVLEAGRVAASGTPAQLRADEGAYARLLRAYEGEAEPSNPEAVLCVS